MGVTTDPITCSKKGSGKVAVYNVTNDLAAGGTEPVAILVSALFPKKTTEEKIKAYMEEIEETCSSLNVQIVGGHTEITDAVTRPVLTLTGIGKTKKEHMICTKNADELSKDKKKEIFEKLKISKKEIDQIKKNFYWDPIIRNESDYSVDVED